MFLVKVLDSNEIETYETLEEIYSNCESIDVYEGLYEFSDVDGNRYDVIWTKEFRHYKVLWFFDSFEEGKYELVKREN